MSKVGRATIASLRAELAQEREKSRALEIQRSVLADLKATIPVGGEDRKNYVSRVAIFFPNTLKPQLQKMIYMQADKLVDIEANERLADFYRANINCLNLLLDWGEAMTNEHMGDIEEAKRNQESDATITSEIKAKYL